MTGEWPKKSDVDHINGVKSDNRWCNLREATRAENTSNTQIRITNTSGYKGVGWHKHHKKWSAQIRVDGYLYYLGLFDTPEEAAAMFEGAAKMLRGEFHRITIL
jgi:hypothetical protein